MTLELKVGTTSSSSPDFLNESVVVKTRSRTTTRQPATPSASTPEGLRGGESTATAVFRVLHIAESFAGGVGNAILDYAASLPEFEHHLIYGERDDSPISRSVLGAFSSAVPMGSSHSARLRTVRDALRSREWDVVHAHSSYAGVYARVANLGSRNRMVYTPHCYASERLDVSLTKRVVFRLVERSLALRTGVFAACSEREAELSTGWPRRAVVYVPNIAVSGGFDREHAYDGSRALHIVGAGRDAVQKDPDFFLKCVQTLRGRGLDVRATWIGGSDALRARFAPAGIDVTGWLTRDAALSTLGEADLYVHTAAWEGFPVAILEAAAVGVPLLARKIPAYAGMDIPQFDDPDDLATIVSRLRSQADLCNLVQRTRSALAPNTCDRQRAALIEAYESASGRRLAPVAAVATTTR
ncbi:glycosyltransferase involved in cell wall biosynthesis [Microbacterium proteolyticum]|nr:glycosyltransferase involved in cell wall biosynthesis [Microbacterium sp. SORGH_AS_0344]MDQ1170863.1 glycosyltransferase involved in cell wall biosynthesis [Microbacterium proteolyticum]